MRLSKPRMLFVAALAACSVPLSSFGDVSSTRLPDGRTIAPVGFTVPVEGFASNETLSPDDAYLAVVSEDGGAVDIIDTKESMLAERLRVPGATNLAWTSDGLYVSRGYSGMVARFSYAKAEADDGPAFTKRSDLDTGGPGLVAGIVEDPATHRVAVARSADGHVVVLDDGSGGVVATLNATGQPFDVLFSGNDVVASNYNGDHIDIWRGAAGTPVTVATGPHPTRMLLGGGRVFVSNADGSTVSVVDVAAARIAQTYSLAPESNQPPGQTPSGMALSADTSTLYVCESGFNDVAVVDTHSGAVRTRIPTAWYPMAVTYLNRSTVGKKDPRKKEQLWVVSARGIGQQPNPGGEWNGHMTGLVQHVVVDTQQFDRWSADVARNNHFGRAPLEAALPPIKHVVFIVVENKHFDEQFGDEPRANADPALLVYGRTFTPNAHALAEHYAMLDEFMGNGDASIYGHAWAVQGSTNDYHERNARIPEDASTAVARRVPYSIWPYAQRGEDTLTQAQMDFDWFKNLADLPGGPRTNPSAIFGPRGELIDELARRGVSFRVYGEQMTMLPNGTIAPGLATHAAREYPGAHIDFGVLDTDRAQRFERDLQAHGLASYTYVTLPTNHTAGSAAGFYTPQSYVANNDLALGQIVEALSKRPEWKSTLIIVAPDDAQGTGDHVDAKRMPVFAIGPYVRRGAVDHTLYSFPSVLRTVEVLFHCSPLNIEDAGATPIDGIFTRTPQVAIYHPIPESIAMTKNPGKTASLFFPLDGPASAKIPDQEWVAVRGARTLHEHHAYLARLGTSATAVADADDSQR